MHVKVIKLIFFSLYKNLYWQFKAIYNCTHIKNFFTVLYVRVFSEYACITLVYKWIKWFLFYFSSHLLGSNWFVFNSNQINKSNQNPTLEEFKVVICTRFFLLVVTCTWFFFLFIFCFLIKSYLWIFWRRGIHKLLVFSNQIHEVAVHAPWPY